MFAILLIGWAMLSAGSYPGALFDGVALSAVLSHIPAMYGVLRPLHGVLAHLVVALYQAWVKRDGVFG